MADSGYDGPLAANVNAIWVNMHDILEKNVCKIAGKAKLFGFWAVSQNQILCELCNLIHRGNNGPPN